MGYKVYVEKTTTGYTRLPRFGTSYPGFVSSWYKRHGFSTAKDADSNKYIHRSVYDAADIRTKRPGEIYFGPEVYGFAFNANSIINLDHVKPIAGQRVWNKAYENFKEKAVGETSSLGITFAQWRQSLGMVANRAWQLGSAARHLLRGRPNSFLTALGLAPQPKYSRRNRDYTKKGADIFLEYSFGWKPLVTDMHSAMLQCEENPPAYHAAQGSSLSLIDSRVSPGNYVYLQGGYSVTQRATVNVINPNLFLASQLGLVNPGSVVFDAIPFSFVVDWFFDVQNWIDSFTDFLGVAVSDAAITETYRGAVLAYPYDPKVYLQVPQEFNVVRLMRRRPGLIRPYPNLDVLGNSGKSLVRAANAVSLLTQILLKIQKAAH